MKDSTFQWARAVAMGLLVVFGAAAGQTVVTEPRATLRPAGKGQKPFDVTCHTIPIADITDGGPPRDGIRALVGPHFVSADEMRNLLKNSDHILGIVLSGEAKAYPVRILNWHELVNDSVGGQPVLVSW